MESFSGAVSKGKSWLGLTRLTRMALLPYALMLSAAFVLAAAVPARAQSDTGQANTGQSAPADAQKPAQAQEIPDAPSTVQPPAPERLDKPPATQPPATDKPAKQAPKQDNYGQGITEAPPPMPPVETVPPGTTTVRPPRNQINPQEPQEDTLKFITRVDSVQIPVTVKDKRGIPVDGLRPKDFTVLENGQPQRLTYFTTDPFELSVAVVVDQGMPDVALQKINQTFSALSAAFSVYDEVALYTYTSTVSQVSGYLTTGQKLTAVMNQLKTETGHTNGVAVLSGPMASGPVVNGIPVGSPSVPVSSPERESHVLNDAILRAALDLSKRDRRRHKVIFVISDGRELGSRASYSGVVKVLLAQGIQVKAVAVESSAIPVYRKLEKFHLPLQGYNDLLPRYTAATGGGKPYSEFSQNAIEDAYAAITSDVRNQYTLGYYTRATASTVCRDLEVRVDYPGLVISTKDKYCPAAQSRAQ